MVLLLKTVALFNGILLACASDSAMDVVQTKSGSVRGTTWNTTSGTVRAFLSIPYAEPPLGENRFRMAIPKKPWTDIYNATKLPQICMQGYQKQLDTEEGKSEDCLYLNVFVPTGTDSLVPVLVYIHGGAFIYGGITQKQFDTSELASQGRLVTVNIAYRLGAFGFLNYGSEDAPNNVGLYDQTLALRWVKENIESFGGDPEKITIMGESAGSMSVGMHMISLKSRGLFKGAVMQSGSPYSNFVMTRKEQSDSLLSKLIVALKCGTPLSLLDKSTLECLRSKDAVAIVNASAVAMAKGFQFFCPLLEDEFAPEMPSAAFKSGKFNGVSLIASVTEGEGDSFFYEIVSRIRNITSAETITKPEVMMLMVGYLVKAVGLGAKKVLKHYFDQVPVTDNVKALQAAGDTIGHVSLICPTRDFARMYSEQNNPVYAYVLT